MAILVILTLSNISKGQKSSVVKILSFDAHHFRTSQYWIKRSLVISTCLSRNLEELSIIYRLGWFLFNAIFHLRLVSVSTLSIYESSRKISRQFQDMTQFQLQEIDQIKLVLHYIRSFYHHKRHKT